MDIANIAVRVRLVGMARIAARVAGMAVLIVGIAVRVAGVVDIAAQVAGIAVRFAGTPVWPGIAGIPVLFPEIAAGLVGIPVQGYQTPRTVVLQHRAPGSGSG